MKKVSLILVVIFLLVIFTGCFNQYTINGYKISQGLVKFEGDILRFVINNNYGDKITNIINNKETGLSFTLKTEIFYKEEAIKNNLGSIVNVESPDEIEYYIDISNLLFFNGDKNDYNDLLNYLKDKDIINKSYKDSKDYKVTIERRNDNIYVKHEILK